MMRRILAIGAVGLWAGVGVGCGRPGGILLTPVPADKRLEETVLRRDAGWLVRDKIVIVEVSGLLVNAEMGPMLGEKENPVSLFGEKLDKAADDGQVKAVLLRINSPGGTVGASDLMHRQLTDFRRKRPDVRVAASILDMGTSGGYYLACGADKIYATPSSVTGSIGVIFQTFSIEGTLKLIGVHTQAIKSGENKDLASPLRGRTAEEVKLLQSIIDQFHRRFLDVVLASRRQAGMTPESLAALADGRIFTGPEAVNARLVDGLLYPEQVIDQLRKDAQLTRAKVVMYNRPLGYKGGIYARSGQQGPMAGTINLLNVDLASVFGPHQPQFLYLWTAP